MRQTMTLPLHDGKAPQWLMSRMKHLATAMLEVMLLDYKPAEILEKLVDPHWFQALGCVLGFDWHSSGLTTTTLAAFKHATEKIKDSGIIICGGKGQYALKTPYELARKSPEPGKHTLISRLASKIDNHCIQDGYNLYIHSMIISNNGRWGIIQQGMNRDTLLARRYHWDSRNLETFTREPHLAVLAYDRLKPLNLVTKESGKIQSSVISACREGAETVTGEILKAINMSFDTKMPSRFSVTARDINPKKLYKTIISTYETNIESFEDLLKIKGVGAKTLRALTLVSEMLYGEKATFKDPARFSFAHGGKDGTPYPVNKQTYDKTISTLREFVNKAKIGQTDKIKSLKKLHKFGSL